MYQAKQRGRSRVETAQRFGVADREFRIAENCLRMLVWIVRDQPFGDGDAVQEVVGRKKMERRKRQGNPHLLQFQRRGELHGITPAQAVLFGQHHGSINQRLGHSTI